MHGAVTSEREVEQRRRRVAVGFGKHDLNRWPNGVDKIYRFFTRLHWIRRSGVANSCPEARRTVMDSDIKRSDAKHDNPVVPWRDLLLVARHEPVGQRLHEAHDRILLCVRQAQAPNSARVHVVGRFRRRPACRTFIDVMGLAARQDVARVVEMHDRLQAREISVVPIGLHEARIGPLVHIAQCRHLKSRLGCLAPA